MYLPTAAMSSPGRRPRFSGIPSTLRPGRSSVRPRPTDLRCGHIRTRPPAVLRRSCMLKFRMHRFQLLAPFLLLCLLPGCDRFQAHAGGEAGSQRVVCIGQAYNEIIYDLGAEANLVTVD